jgi:DNA polymerase-3 subunit alpha (Gram-positive type)
VHPENGARPEFISVDELSRACPKVSQTCFEQLRTIGALRDLPESSQITFFEL